MKVFGRVDVQLHAFLTSALDGGEARAALQQEKSPWYTLDRRLCGPNSRSGRSGEEKDSQPSAIPLTIPALYCSLHL
jgi:hypothetical protein